MQAIRKPTFVFDREETWLIRDALSEQAMQVSGRAARARQEFPTSNEAERLEALAEKYEALAREIDKSV